MGTTVISVSQLNLYVKNVLECDTALKSVYISGEISNFTNHYSSGHFYFTLKDEKSSVKSVMFKYSALKVQFVPQNGMKVICHGRVSLYERDGSYQFYVDDMQPDGVGALLLAYEQLKLKLSEAGLFDEKSKRPLPRFPSKIGVVTSSTGAALQDIINVLSRRYPIAEVLVYPALVQGQGAPESLIKAINTANLQGVADVLIVGRGGGSIEDLWAFNDEKLAYAIFESNIPVVSAVGHEIDYTICDFVADLRAPTPSAAAELVAPDAAEISVYLSSLGANLAYKLNSVFKENQNKLNYIEGRRCFASPLAFLDVISERLDNLEQSIILAQKNSVVKCESQLSLLAATIDATSPLKTLSRGYAIPRSEGKVLRSVDSFKEGTEFSLTLSDGRIECETTGIHRGDNQ